jgi:hypothetical protein
MVCLRLSRRKNPGRNSINIILDKLNINPNIHYSFKFIICITTKQQDTGNFIMKDSSLARQQMITKLAHVR